MMYTVNVTVDDIIDALGDFIELFVGGADIIRGQVNRTPPPSGQYVELTEILSNDLAVPYQEYVASLDPEIDGETNLIGRVRVDVQADFYGSQSGDWCRAVQNAIRTGYGYSVFSDDIKPLYTTDGFQHPWNTGEQQSVTRWTLTVSIQYNPQLTVPQQFAETLTPTVEVPVDET